MHNASEAPLGILRPWALPHASSPLLAHVVVLEVKWCLRAFALEKAVLDVESDISSMSLHRCELKLLVQCHEWEEHELSLRKEAQGSLGSLLKTTAFGRQNALILTDHQRELPKAPALLSLLSPLF